MEILIIGGDMRYLEIIKSLKEKHHIDLIGYTDLKADDCQEINLDKINIGKYDIIIFPINGVNNNIVKSAFSKHPIILSEDFLIGTKEKVLIFSGIKTPSFDHMLRKAARKAIYLMEDQEIIKENAYITVEGIIADLINNTNISIKSAKIFIIGYGNIGQILVNYLINMGAHIKVGIIEEKDKKVLDQLKLANIYTNNDSQLANSIMNSDIIINTVPKVIINDQLIKYINSKTYVLDISSYPHGINQRLLDQNYIKNKIYLGIPGKIAPKSSGKILSKKINNIMEG